MEDIRRLSNLDPDEIPRVLVREQPELNFLNDSMVVLPEISSAILIAGNVLVLIFAFCGNVAASIVCLRSKFSRPGTRFFLLSLALSDMVGVAFSVTTVLSQILATFNSWVLGDFMCKIAAWLQTFVMMANGFALIAISIDRYLAVVRGLKGPLVTTQTCKYLTFVFMALIWIIPLAASCPILLVYGNFPYWVWYKEYVEELNATRLVTDNTTYYICMKKPDYLESDKWHYIVLGVVYAWLVATLIFSYVSIMQFVKRNLGNFHLPPPPDPTPLTFRTTSSSRPISDSKIWNQSSTTGDFVRSATTAAASTSATSFSHHHLRKRHLRTGRLLWTLISVLLFCRLPNWIFLLVITWRQDIPWTASMASVQYSLVLLSDIKSALNPFLYTIWNDALRSPQAGQSMFRKKGRRGPSAPSRRNWLKDLLCPSCCSTKTTTYSSCFSFKFAKTFLGSKSNNFYDLTASSRGATTCSQDTAAAAAAAIKTNRFQNTSDNNTTTDTGFHSHPSSAPSG